MKTIFSVLAIFIAFTFFIQNTTLVSFEQKIFSSNTNTPEKSTLHKSDYKNKRQVENFTVDCNSDFWTITADGYIQQWSLSNGTVSGGDTILSGGGISLSYCNFNNTPTFFSNNYNPVGIIYYDPVSGWIQIPTPVVVNNNGGHLNDQYFMVEGAVIQVVKYWDGTNLLTVDSLDGEFFAGTQDIGVDTFGHAWVFTGQSPSIVGSLKVYDQNGLINSYSFQFDDIAYGSFFLNDTLYIGTVQGSIYPIIIDGSTAHLGNSIPFPSNSFTDMASCQRLETTTSSSEYPKPQLKLFPNPTNGYITLPLDIGRSGISVYNSQGQLVKFKLNGELIDITEQPEGVYFIRVDIEGWPYFYEIIKF